MMSCVSESPASVRMSARCWRSRPCWGFVGTSRSSRRSRAETREDDALLSIVEVALHANLLVDGQATPTELQFVHPLVQETLYSSLSAARRAVLHRRCGDVLARRGYPSAIVAHHYATGATADSAEQTVEWLTRAAGELVESVAIDEALALLDRALVVSDLAVLPHHVAKARLHLAMSLVFGLIGDTVPSRRQAELAADEARVGC